MENQVALLRVVVTETGFGGDPAAEETYINEDITILQYEELVDAVMAAKPEQDDLGELVKSGELRFDWRKVSTKSFHEFQRGGTLVKNQIPMLCQVVETCPAEWGTPDQAETYWEMPYLTYLGLWQAATEARQGSNFR